MKEENLISIDQLIKSAKKEGVGFGKSDPYNRLRYYTKISLLPHMERRLGKGGKLEAFYPKDALPKLIKIEGLKEKGLSNEDILKELKKEEISFKSYLASKINTKNLVISASSLFLLIIVLHQRGVITLGKENDQKLLNPDDVTKGLNVVDSGTNVLKGGKNKTFVRSTKVTELSQIEVAFKDSYEPAQNFWIETRIPQEGFILSLDNQISQEASFSWWVLEN